jgi:ABC-2 type transport system permease protein
MADIARSGEEPAFQGGAMGRMALRQYAALLGMRWRMVVNSVRSVQGAFELGARGVAFIIYSIMGLSLGFGLGAGAYSMVSGGHPQFLPLLFWTVFLVWQVVPIALASFQEQFDLSGLLRFPVSFGSFFLLNVVFGLVDVPALLGGICCLGILAGITLARPQLFESAVLVLALYALFNIVLARTVLAWIDRWLAKRRTREIVSAIFLLMMLSLQLLNPALHNGGHFQKANHEPSTRNENQYLGQIKPLTDAVSKVEPWTPAGVAADGVTQRADRSSQSAMGVLGLYIFATGGLLALRLRREYRGEKLSDTPAARKRNANDAKWLIDGSGPVAAVMEKELRIIPRSMPLLFAMGAPLVTVLIISTVIRNSATGYRPFELAFPLCVCYALLGFTQMIFNNLGAEGTGIQMLFLSPTPIEKVLLAKNLIHGVLFLIVAFLAGIFASLRLGEPDLLLVATTAAWVLFALPAHLAAGNILSLTMPYRVNLGRISRQRGSQASALVSMLIQVVVMGSGAAVFELCAYFQRRWLAAPVLLVLAAVAGIAWTRVLAHAGALANRNRDNLIAMLARTE